jgi:hypothetical protein
MRVPWVGCAAVAIQVLWPQAMALAQPGDFANIRAYWIEKPYALLRDTNNRSPGEACPATLIRGRDGRVYDDYVSCDPDDVVELGTVETEVSRIAVTGSLLIMERADRELPYSVVSSRDPEASPTRFHTWEECRAFIRDRPGVSLPLHFRTFEEIAAERDAQVAGGFLAFYWSLALAVGWLALVVTGAVLLLRKSL